MSRLKQVIFAYTCEPGSVQSLCYYGSWNIREGGGSDNLICQSMPTISPSPFLAPSWQVAFGGAIQSLAFSSPLVVSVLCNLFCCFLLFLWTFWEYMVSTGMTFCRQVVGVLLLSRRSHGQGPAQLQGSGTSVTRSACSPSYWNRRPLSAGCCRCSKHCLQRQEHCNGLCQDNTSVVRVNMFPCFMLTQRWKDCPQCLSEELHTRQRKEKLPLLSKPGSLSARTDMPGQTANLPVLPLLPACWGCPEGPAFFPACKCSMACGDCSTGTCFCWGLGGVAVLCGNLHIPIFNNVN